MSKEDILNYRLPARLRELNTFIMMASQLEKAIDISVSIDGNIYAISDRRFVLDPIADGASLMARGLLHFLGIGLSSKGLATVNWRKDDLTIEDVGLSAIQPTNAVDRWSITTERATYLLSLCISTGNKVSAHLTKENAQTLGASISDLRQAFVLVTDLVNREVYDALGLIAVVFDKPDRLGSISRLPVVD